MRHIDSYRKPFWDYSDNQQKDYIAIKEICSFFPKQMEAWEAAKTHKYTLYGGTKGAGKSRWIRFVTVALLFQMAGESKQSGIRAGIFCEDYPSLKDRHITKIAEEFPKGMGKFYTNHREHGLCYILAPFMGGGIIAFRNLDDVSKYESSEFAIIAVDELQKDSLHVFQTLRTRLRWPGVEQPKFIGGAIPGGEPYITQYWVDRQFAPDEKEQDQFVFIQALPSDNAALSKDYYDKTLASLTAEEYEAYAKGDFHAFDNTRDAKGWERLLSYPELNNAQIKPEIVFGSGIRILGVDPGAGGDESAIVERTDTTSEILFNEKLKDTMALIPIIAKFEKERGKYDSIPIDIIGVGRGVYDRMVELGYMNVLGVAVGAPPQNIKKDSRTFGQKTYRNLRAQIFDRAKTWVLRGGKLVRNPEWNQLGNIKYKTDSDRMMQMQSKDEMRREGIRSPNVADAFSLTFVEEDEQITAMKQYQAQEEAKALGMEDVIHPTGFGFADG